MTLDVNSQTTEPQHDLDKAHAFARKPILTPMDFQESQHISLQVKKLKNEASITSAVCEGIEKQLSLKRADFLEQFAQKEVLPLSNLTG